MVERFTRMGFTTTRSAGGAVLTLGVVAVVIVLYAVTRLHI